MRGLVVVLFMGSSSLLLYVFWLVKNIFFLLFLCFECRKIGLDCGFVEFLGNN
jgi:hypothetical protein